MKPQQMNKSKPNVVISPKYAPITQTESRYYIVTGGRGSSKSFSIASLLTLLTCEGGHKILFTRYTMTSAEISIIPEFLEKIELFGLKEYFHITKNEIVNKTTGSKILFRGIKTSSGDQSANLKSLQGITTFVVEEAEELVDEDTFDKIDLSVRQKGIQNRVILVMNPATKEHWIYKRFFEQAGVTGGSNTTKGDTTYIHTTYKDNEANVSKSFIKNMERMRRDKPKKYLLEILGGWQDSAEGVVFSDWSTGEYNPNELQVTYGMDFGFTNDPTTLIGVAIDKKKRIIYAKEYMYNTGISTTDTANIVLLTCGKNLVVADSAEPRMIDEMRKQKCNIVGAKKGAGSINAGIALIQDYDLVVCPESLNLAKELNNYAYSHKKSGTLIDNYNHLLDALRYSVSYTLMGNGKIEIR